jgi:hypothetical protein
MSIFSVDQLTQVFLPDVEHSLLCEIRRAKD